MLMNYILSLVMSIPMFFVMALSDMTDFDPVEFLQSSYLVYMAGAYYLLVLAVSFLFLVITQVIIGVQYYSLAEAVENTGAKNLINEIGQDA